MARITRTVHPSANFFWKPLAKLAPDLAVTVTDPDDPPMGLLMLDADGSVEVYVFNEDGRRRLVETLTGGIVLPDVVRPLLQ